MKHYNYIFVGTGLAALMVVKEMINSGKFKQKSILLIDNSLKKTNDRTWCFWEQTALFSDITTHQWNNAWFKNENFQTKLDLAPYQYNFVKGIDFYNMVFEQIVNETNIYFENQNVISFEEKADLCLIKTTNETFSCDKIFNSIFDPEIILNQNKYPLLQQHFIGWFIRSKEAIFDPNCATFMDFSVAQKGNTRFMYVLPTSANEALIEYTLFSKELLIRSEYEYEIEEYIRQLGITEYEIIEKEMGNIPMTSYPFWKHNTKNIINIGSAGGWTKASTGYTFKNTYKISSKLVTFLETKSDFRKFHKKTKFWFYDLLLLDILNQKNELGATIFSSLFKQGDAALLFKFLDEETSFLEDLRVIWKCPKKLFIIALLGRVLGSRF